MKFGSVQFGVASFRLQMYSKPHFPPKSLKRMTCKAIWAYFLWHECFFAVALLCSWYWHFSTFIWLLSAPFCLFNYSKYLRSTFTAQRKWYIKPPHLTFFLFSLVSSSFFLLFHLLRWNSNRTQFHFSRLEWRIKIHNIYLIVCQNQPMWMPYIHWIQKALLPVLFVIDWKHYFAFISNEREKEANFFHALVIFYPSHDRGMCIYALEIVKVNPM